MRLERKAISYQWMIPGLCFCLMLQGSGIAQALPLPPKKTLLTKAELDSARRHRAAPGAELPEEPGLLERFVDRAKITVEATGSRFQGWLEDSWAPPAAESARSFRVAQGGGGLPLPARLIPAFFAMPPPQAGPPSPPGFAGGKVEATPTAQANELLEKAGTDEIPLIAGWNLISLPHDPPDPDPAVVFAPIAGQLLRVEHNDVCDTADPWKIYDPADPASSNLTAVTPAMGLWVKVSEATILPLTGSLPDTTTIELCPGWNHIGFAAGQARHPYAALSLIAGKWQRIFGHDAFDTEDPFEYFDPAIPAWANDLAVMRPGFGYWLLASEATILEIRNQGPPPTIAFAAPLDLSVVTQPTEVTGTIDSDRLESWALTAQPFDDGPPVTLATGNTPVADAPLGDFDPTLLLNGLYELELTATDFQGQQVSDSIAVTVDGQMKIGNFSLSFVDLRVPVSGLDIEIVRTYRSRDKEQRDFGVGWSLDIRQGSYRNNRAPGDGWRIVASDPPVPFPCVGTIETESHTTVIRLSDQEIYRFRPTVIDTIPGVGRCDGKVVFEYVDGPLPGTTLEIIGNDLVYYENAAGNDQLIDYDTLATFEPRNVRLTTRDGRIFELDLENGVTLVEDLNGNQLTITPAGITHSSGKGIAFSRDTEGRIETIEDPRGAVMGYGYEAGKLATFTDRENHTSSYFYGDEGLLEEIQDPRGIKPIRNDYDDDGRLISVTDAFGKVIQVDHDIENRREIVTNRLGHVRILEYDARGNVVRELDENQKETRREYDSRDNMTREIDPLDHVAQYFYDADSDLFRIIDPELNQTEFTHNSRGQVLTTTNPRGKVAEFRYDPAGNLEYTKDPTGAETVFTYYPDGNLETETDAELGISRYEYDSFGNQTRVIDALDHATDWTYDANGNRRTETTTRTLPDGSTETLATTYDYDDLDRLKKTTYPDATTTETRYDLLGKVSETIDQRQRSTTFHYDDMGRLERTEYPDETLELRTYDEEGQLIEQLDRGGRPTSFEYDPVGRQTKTTFADLAFTINRYDDAGRLIEFENARRHVTHYEYDAAGRRTKITDALDGVTDFEYDPAGNQAAVVDPNRHRTDFEYDDANRLVRTIFPGVPPTDRHIAYDKLGRRISETDQADKTTQFRYDKLGRLVKIIDALLQETDYVYDELGNRTQQIDANDHVTRFEYDALGRQTARILPSDTGGDRESTTYYPDGTLLSHTDFNGATRTFEFDTNRRLVRRAYPDGSDVRFTYTPTGQRKTVVDPRGTTSYDYDLRDRLTEKVDPTGYSLTYGYDEVGNRTRLTATVGAEVYTAVYTHDALNRVATVTDSQEGVTTLGYDANGNQTSLGHPNGVTTGYTFDEHNRLIDLRTVASAGDVLQSYEYTLGVAGNRIRIDEHDGTSRHYTCDDLYRLIQDRVIDPADALVYQQDFVYDPVGNRLEQTIDEGSGLNVVESTYDDRDRLLTAGSTSYNWNDNGNLLSGADRSFEWDLENRLSMVTRQDGTHVEITYDADGNRVRTMLTASDGGITTIDYLVDTNSFLSHVILEVVDRSTQAIYTRSQRQLISLYRPSTEMSKYYHSDGLGSIRVLSGETGGATDRYAFSAFGQLIEHLGVDTNSHLFAGEPFDHGVGFYFNRARWLDAASGRFASADPFAGSIDNPASLHKYGYAEQNPSDHTDPTGLAVGLSLGQVLFSSFIGAIVSAAGTAIAADALGVKVTKTEIALAALYGAVLGPVALAFPTIGLLSAGAGVASSGYVLKRVLQNSNSTSLQRVEAVALVLASVFGARLAYRYYKTVVPRSVAAGKPVPNVPQFPLRNLPAPKGVELYSYSQTTLRGDKIPQIPGIMRSMYQGRPINPIGGWRSGNKYVINEGHHRIVAALAVFKETGNTRPLLTLLKALPQGSPPSGPTMPLTAGPPAAIPILPPLPPGGE